MSNFEKKQQTRLMKSIAKVARNTPDQDLILASNMFEIRGQLLTTLINSAAGRQALVEYARDCISNKVNKADFIVNLNSTKEQAEGDSEDSKKSIQIIEELVVLVESINAENIDENSILVAKHRFSLKTFQFASESIRITDPMVSLRLTSLVSGYLKARDTMILPHMRLVHTLAKPFLIRTTCHDLEDLTAQGFEGLVKAADRFDPKLGLHFGTYASNWIKQVISRYIMDTGSIVRHPVHLAENINDILSKTSKLEGRTGLPASDEEIAKATNLTVEKIKKAKSAISHFVSLDTPVSEGSNMTFSECLPDNEAVYPDQLAHENEMKALLDSIIADTLDERAQKVIRLRYGLGTNGEELTHEAVSLFIDRTKERSRQIETEGLELLRARKKTNLLKDYI